MKQRQAPQATIRKIAAARARGQAMVAMAIAFAVMMGFVAITVDAGSIWMNRRVLQNSVDAAALAAAQELPGSASGARSVGCSYATDKNDVTGMYGKTGSCAGLADVVIGNSSISNDMVTVTAYKNIAPVFGGLIGMQPKEISATAQAVVGSASESCPFPVFVTEDILPPGSYPDKVAFNGLVKIDFKGDAMDVGSGANGVEQGMYGDNCNADLSIGASVDNKPGEMTGPLLRGFEWRIYCAGGNATKPNNSPACPSGMPGASTCPSANMLSYLVTVNGVSQLPGSINRVTCPRLVIVPVLDGTAADYDRGKSSGHILGFAYFYIGGVCTSVNCNNTPVGSLEKGDSWGYYVKAAFVSDLYTGYDGYGTRVVALSN